MNCTIASIPYYVITTIAAISISTRNDHVHVLSGLMEFIETGNTRNPQAHSRISCVYIHDSSMNVKTVLTRIISIVHVKSSVPNQRQP